MNQSTIVGEMIKGFGTEFSEEELWGIVPSEEYVRELESIIPATGRYLKSVAFLKDVTSGKAVAKKRFYVIGEYLISLSELMAGYHGPYRKIIGELSPEDKAAIRKIGTTITEIMQAEYIEKFTDHDTAAAVDLFKLRMAKELPHLADQVEAAHFGCTSDDVMGNVFGLIANELVYEHFSSALYDFIAEIINYSRYHETDGPLIIPGFTHGQAAEPMTLGVKFLTRIVAIMYLCGRMRGEGWRKLPFSGKMGGAIGNLTCHYAAYPDIDWWTFAAGFVGKLGLHYESMTDQCATFVVEAMHFSTIAHILTQIIKLTNDFIDMTNCPAQFFVKAKKKGRKGSSLMPNKSNPWGMEGAVGMLEEARSKLLFLSVTLPDYPHEGNMKRSYLLRNIGDAFMPIFIALKRITKEMKSYSPNPGKINAFFEEYPGMAGSSLQTVLKRENVAGDAYRAIQDISINADGTYANAEQFAEGLKMKMDQLELDEHFRKELLSLLNPGHLVRPVHERAWQSREAVEKIIG